MCVDYRLFHRLNYRSNIDKTSSQKSHKIDRQNKRLRDILLYVTTQSKRRIESALRVAKLSGDLVDGGSSDERADSAIGGIDALIRSHDVSGGIGDDDAASRRVLDLLAHHTVGTAHSTDRSREMVSLIR